MILPRRLFLLLLPLLAAASAPPPLKFATDNSGADELICHPGRDCYPRLFHATDEFRIVEHDQEVPPGLHIRMDMATGQREAKLNVPSESDHENEAVVVVPSIDDSASPSPPAVAPPPPQQRLKPPKTQPDGTFASALAALPGLAPGSPEDTTLQTLSNLVDLVHEAYWGDHLTSTPHAVASLLSLLSSPHASVRANAALVLGSALSNNPQALTHALDAQPVLLGGVLSALGAEGDDAATRRLLFLLAQVLRDKGVRGEFVGAKREEVLVGVFRRGGAAVKGRVAVVVEDAFLNADMRAEGEAAGAGEEGLVVLCEPFKAAVKELGEKEEREKVRSALRALEGRFGCRRGVRSEL